MAKLMLSGVRLAFANLFKPTSVESGGELSYSCSLLLPPDHKQVKEINAAIEAVGVEKWGAKWPTVKKEIMAKDRGPLHDGETKASYAGFEGMLFISARTKVSARPTVIDRDKTPLTEEDGRVYSGCYVNASIELWAQDNSFGKRINAQIRGVQFVRDGDAFGGGSPASSDEFDEVTEGADADDLA